jgi:hypothetical protein
MDAKTNRQVDGDLVLVKDPLSERMSLATVQPIALALPEPIQATKSNWTALIASSAWRANQSVS